MPCLYGNGPQNAVLLPEFPEIATVPAIFKPLAFHQPSSPQWNLCIIQLPACRFVFIPTARMPFLKSSRKPDWWFYASVLLVLAYILLHLVLFFGDPAIRPLLYMVGVLLLAVLAVLFWIIALIHSLLKRPFLNPWRVIGMLLLVFIPLVYALKSDTGGFLVRTYPSSYADHKSAVSFRLPLEDSISVAWGGDQISQNYHAAYADQRWAYDFFILRDGQSFDGDSTQLTSYFCYGKPILSPAAGKVVLVTDSLPDMPIGVTNVLSPCGNHIVVQVAPKEFLFMCHLKPGSVRVQAGDSIRQGAMLAQIGNSGNTSEPHLHIHLQNNKHDLFGEGVPLFFDHYFSGKRFVRRGMPTGGLNADNRFAGETIIHARARN